MIERITVKNYKSLRNADLDLRPLSVFIGPNSAGKSNLFDALSFMHDLASVGQNAVRNRGSFDTLVWSGNVQNKVAFDLTGKLPAVPNSGISQYRFQYSIELSADQYVGWQNSGERFSIYKNDEVRLLLEYPDKDKMASIYNLDGEPLGQQGLANVGSLLQFLSVSPGREDPLRLFSEYVKGWAIFDPTPALMRGPTEIKRELRLSPRGENLSGVLHTLRSEFPDIFDRVQDHLHQLVPESKNLLALLTEKGATYPGLTERDISSNIPVSSMSAGTLRFLSFLAVLYSPEAPHLICFEEPENNIHPYALELLIDLLKNASRKRQVLITTHSPYLLNSVDPDSVFVFDKEKGETRVTEAGTKKNLKSLLRKVGLGEAWYAGSIGGVPTRTQ